MRVATMIILQRASTEALHSALAAEHTHKACYENVPPDFLVPQQAQVFSSTTYTLGRGRSAGYDKEIVVHRCE